MVDSTWGGVVGPHRMWWGMVWSCTVRYGIVRCGKVWYGTVQHRVHGEAGEGVGVVGLVVLLVHMAVQPAQLTQGDFWYPKKENLETYFVV